MGSGCNRLQNNFCNFTPAPAGLGRAVHGVYGWPRDARPLRPNLMPNAGGTIRPPATIYNENHERDAIEALKLWKRLKSPRTEMGSIGETGFSPTVIDLA